jgi:hypothetical protein
MSTDQDSMRESRARRAIARIGYSLAKSRRRDDRYPDFGLFHIVDPYRNAVIAGGSPWAFSMSLDDVEAWIAS